MIDSLEQSSNQSSQDIIPDDDAPHLLVIDDDTRIRTLLKRFLTTKNMRVTTAANAIEARAKLEGFDFDLLIIDVMMPGESGLQLTKSLRESRKIPILMLTALSQTDERINGLEAGADDYLSKPFDPRELVLRIQSILRRQNNPSAKAIEQISFGPFSFDLKRRELKQGTTLIRLTDREQEIFAIFAQRPSQTVPRLDLVSDGADVGERTIDVQINRLRRKIEDDPSNPIYLQTVRGIGYRLSTD